MHQRLSPESIYYRYLQQRKPTLAEIAAVCGLDPAIGGGFVAVTPSALAIVGLAYYVRAAPGAEPTAEPGILIEDRFQALHQENNDEVSTYRSTTRSYHRRQTILLRRADSPSIRSA